MSRLTRRLDGVGRAATIHRQAPVMTALDDARNTICQRYQPSAFSTALGIASLTSSRAFTCSRAA